MLLKRYSTKNKDIKLKIKKVNVDKIKPNEAMGAFVQMTEKCEEVIGILIVTTFDQISPIIRKKLPMLLTLKPRSN